MSHPHFVSLGEARNVRDFLGSMLEKRGHPDRLWVFRGQRDRTWAPTPQIDRRDFAAFRTEISWTRAQHESWLLEEFKKAARPLAPTPPQNQWEWLALAQHHGLATRLLDWTTNSLGALYFACEEQHSTANSAVWCYLHDGATADPADDPFTRKVVTAYWPPHVTQRITVQGGCFTAHPGRSTRSQRPTTWPGKLFQVVIPSTARQTMRRELAQLGITRSTLFPDLDGIAAAINRRAAMDEMQPPAQRPISKPPSRASRSR